MEVNYSPLWTIGIFGIWALNLALSFFDSPWKFPREVTWAACISKWPQTLRPHQPVVLPSTGSTSASAPVNPSSLRSPFSLLCVLVWMTHVFASAKPRCSCSFLSSRSLAWSSVWFCAVRSAGTERWSRVGLQPWAGRSAPEDCWLSP